MKPIIFSTPMVRIAEPERHGMANTRVYRIWCWMIDRCRNDRQGNYGKRGITVCGRWVNSFKAFYADMGDPPSAKHSIDREDMNGHYEPGNCRWATNTMQARNTTRNTVLYFRGRRATIAEWSDRTGLKQATICYRLSAGWTISEALTTPVISRLPKVKPWTLIGMSRSSWYRAGRPS